MKKLLPIVILLVGCKATIPAEGDITIADDMESKHKPGSHITRDETDLVFPKRSEASYVEDTYYVGSREVAIANYTKGKGLTFVNLHDDENTSVLAAVAVIDSLGGQLLQLRHTGERNVKFRVDGHHFEFDPNRMFTDLGAKSSLERFGRNTEEAHGKVREFAQNVVNNIQTDIIFTLHNNSEDNYSASSYLDEYKIDAAEVYLNPNRDPDDFYFVTERLFFDALKVRGYNVVLQNNETATDDGSLSVLAAQRNIPYINIEAQHGHLAEQIDMLLTIYELFN